MGYQHHTTAHPLHDLLETRQTVEVEIVGGLVEQDDVEPRTQQRGKPDTRRLPAGQVRHERGFGCGRAGFESEIDKCGGQTFVQVGCAGRQPVIEGGGVHVGQIVGMGTVGRVGQRGGRRIHRRGGRGASGSPSDVGADRLPRHAGMLLGQPPHESISRSTRHGALQRSEIPGEDP